MKKKILINQTQWDRFSEEFGEDWCNENCILNGMIPQSPPSEENEYFHRQSTPKVNGGYRTK